MVKPFDKWPGIIKVISGYTGGHVENPTYQQVCSDTTGHYEAVQITFDPTIISYEEILSVFWQQIDPTDAGGQFGDRGSSYQTAIFYHTPEQKELAEKSKKELAESGTFNCPIVTPILPGQTILSGRRLPPGLLQKEPIALSALQRRFRPGRFLERHWQNK